MRRLLAAAVVVHQPQVCFRILTLAWALGVEYPLLWLHVVVLQTSLKHK